MCHDVYTIIVRDYVNVTNHNELVNEQEMCKNTTTKFWIKYLMGWWVFIDF